MRERGKELKVERSQVTQISIRFHWFPSYRILMIFFIYTTDEQILLFIKC